MNEEVSRFGRNRTLSVILATVTIGVAIVILYMVSRENYLVFHGLIEIATIVIGFSIFVLIVNARKNIDIRYYYVVGVGFLFISVIDLVHTLAYKGMGVFPGAASDLATELWIAGRYMQAVTLIAAPLLIGRRISLSALSAIYAPITALLLGMIYFGVFPHCFLEGQGLTPFKIWSEYIISFILLLATVALYLKREHFQPKIFRLLVAANLLTVAAELAFTSYISVYGFMNMSGHIFRLAATALTYVAFIAIGMRQPFELLWYSLRQKEKQLEDFNRTLAQRVAERTRELEDANAQLTAEIRQRETAERALTVSETKYRSLFENADEAIFVVQQDRIKFPNPKTLKMSGLNVGELEKTDFTCLVHARDREEFLGKYRRMPQSGEVPEFMPFRIVNKEGSELWVQLTTAPITWEGEPGTLCFLNDISKEKLMEEQFMQAQKMEAVGRLAGGIAHDFNNMLSVINGFAELGMESLPESDPVKDKLRDILGAGERAAALTQQLLAFSRKQVLTPEVIDLNEQVRGIELMLKRLIGEDIELAITSTADLWRTKADPGQIQQIIMNLAVNARDAMPQGGKLTIETHNVEFDDEYVRRHVETRPGAWVLLAVSDNGCGMDKETMSKVFEPFFTTKERGKGTGLGLATVYGIVKQSGGHVGVYSELGVGSTFKIYFPRVDDAPRVKKAAAPSLRPGAGQNILVVDDDDAVRRLVTKILEKGKYKVFEARDGEEALRLYANEAAEIELLLTDMVMPRMGGYDVARQLCKKQPSLKVLFMSGYTDSAVYHNGFLQHSAQFIQKPFGAAQLLVKVQEVLGIE